jgi:hypothetical protein
MRFPLPPSAVVFALGFVLANWTFFFLPRDVK